MTILLGASLGAGLLLILAPWLWPRTDRPDRSIRLSRLEGLLDAAGYSHISPRVPIIGAGVLAFVVAGAAWLILGVPVIVVLGAIVAAIGPFAWLRSRRARLLRSRRGLWPDVCDLLIASVRAGMGLSDAVASLQESAPGPLRPAFAHFARDVAASGHFDSAAERLGIVLSDPVADRIIETLRMARQVGGTELVSVLHALSRSVRAEAALRAEIESRQSWTRGAAILGVVAPWVILVLLAMRPEAAQAYSSPGGVLLIIVGAALSIVAYRVMIRLGRLPEPRRWSR